MAVDATEMLESLVAAAVVTRGARTVGDAEGSLFFVRARAARNLLVFHGELIQVFPVVLIGILQESYVVQNSVVLSNLNCLRRKHAVTQKKNSLYWYLVPVLR
jgi:hypothetical protein